MLQEVALSQAYRVTPTGLYLISTAYQGKRNVQFAFRALGISDKPPLLVIGIQDKNFSREIIQKSGEFVLNVCSENQLHAVDKSRGLSGRNVEDKFVALGLKTVPARHVQAPLVAGCHASVECRVVNEFFVEGLYLFVGEALAAHRDDHLAPICRLAGKSYRLSDPI
ncbi:MAG TPA: flavin reductase family protein [Candidatus Binatia bacterium]